MNTQCFIVEKDNCHKLNCVDKHVTLSTTENNMLEDCMYYFFFCAHIPPGDKRRKRASTLNIKPWHPQSNHRKSNKNARVCKRVNERPCVIPQVASLLCRVSPNIQPFPTNTLRISADIMKPQLMTAPYCYYLIMSPDGTLCSLVLNPQLMRILNTFGAASMAELRSLSRISSVDTVPFPCEIIKCLKARLWIPTSCRVAILRLILHCNLPAYCYLIAESAWRWRCAAAWSCPALSHQQLYAAQTTPKSTRR